MATQAKKSPPSRERMRVAFISDHTLVDSSSGAAISVRTILELMAKQGVDCKSFTQTVVDAPQHKNSQEFLDALKAEPIGKNTRLPWLWRVRKNGVEHYLNKSSSLTRRRLSAIDELRFFHSARDFIHSFKPHVMIVYANGLPELSLMREVRSISGAVVFYLANPGYNRRSDFASVDVVLTDSKATQALYKKKLDLPTTVIGKFIVPPESNKLNQPRDRVTFVNPSPEKGVALFYHIAAAMEKLAPDMRFLVVESRSTLATAERALNLPFSKLTNIESVGLQPDLGAVLSRTQILLLPSFWHESGGRTLLEACYHSIPVIACNHAGPPELLGNAGVLLPVPEASRKNYAHQITPEEAQPWIDALYKLHTEKTHMAERQAAAAELWNAHKPAPRVQGIIKLFNELVVAKRKAATAAKLDPRRKTKVKI